MNAIMIEKVMGLLPDFINIHVRTQVLNFFSFNYIIHRKLTFLKFKNHTPRPILKALNFKYRISYASMAKYYISSL